MLAFEVRVAHLPMSLVAMVWEVLDRQADLAPAGGYGDQVDETRVHWSGQIKSYPRLVVPEPQIIN